MDCRVTLFLAMTLSWCTAALRHTCNDRVGCHRLALALILVIASRSYAGRIPPLSVPIPDGEPDWFVPEDPEGFGRDVLLVHDDMVDVLVEP